MDERELLAQGRAEEGNDRHLEVEDAELTERETRLNRGGQAMRGTATHAPPGFQAPALTAGAGFQAPMPGKMPQGDEAKVRKRAKNRNPNAKAEYVNIKKGKEKDAKKGKAMIYRNVDSMAADPAFEARAMDWEMRFGGFVNDHARTKAMAKKAGDFVLKYLDERFAETNEAVEDLLPALGTKENTFSGAVGNDFKKVQKALKDGSVSVKMNHFQKFAERFFAGDIKKLEPAALNRILGRMGDGVPNPQLTDAISNVRKGERMQSPEGIPGEQWHTRAERNPKTGNRQEDKVKDRSNRTYGEFKKETETDYSQMEKRHMDLAYGPKDGNRLPINEGGERWIINERDKWVKTIRDLSLPLLAGPSGTTARLFQAFQQFGINDQPAHSRAAVIAYIVPNRHHSLVEVMTGAAQNGGPAFQPSQDFYHHIDPFSEAEMRGRLGNFPDEVD